MVTAIVRHKVKEMTKFQSVFEENLPRVWASDCASVKLLREANDPNDVTVICEWPTMEQMQNFFKTEEERGDTGVLERAGVIGQPEGSLWNNYKTYQPE